MNTILSDGYMANPTYDYGAGPVNIKVVDPLNLANGYFECKFRDYTAPNIGNGADTASWVIYRYANKGDATPIDSVSSERTIASNNEQIIPQWGVSVQIFQTKYTGIGNLASKYAGMIDEHRFCRFTVGLQSQTTMRSSYQLGTLWYTWGRRTQV
jgi:hypothetical protein